MSHFLVGRGEGRGGLYRWVCAVAFVCLCVCVHMPALICVHFISMKTAHLKKKKRKPRLLDHVFLNIFRSKQETSEFLV